METVDGQPILQCASPQAWEDWLDVHHAQPQGVWLKNAKKGSGISSMTHAEALDVALCYGWIDGQRKTFDDTYYLQKFTPRRPKSFWSQINTRKVEQLIEAGRLRPAGMREVEAARRDGRWAAAYASQSNMTVPDDLLAELDRHPAARAFFETLNKANRYAICYRIENARRPETRRARIEKFIAMLAAGEKLYP
jgi:uncharacterized protein YdeI (YjbR/CyaY-like superfamily)